MTSRAKKYPEVDLGPIMFAAVKAYLGGKAFAKLGPMQRTKVNEICVASAKGIAAVITPPVTLVSQGDEARQA